MADNEIKFLASFPPIQSAIKITGNGDGMRIQLDIPETQMADAIYLLQLREKIIEVTIREHEQEQSVNRQATAIKRTTAKKRK